MVDNVVDVVDEAVDVVDEVVVDEVVEVVDVVVTDIVAVEVDDVRVGRGNMACRKPIAAPIRSSGYPPGSGVGVPLRSNTKYKQARAVAQDKPTPKT